MAILSGIGSTVGDFLLGQDPSKVALPPEMQAAARAREQLMRQLQAQAIGTDVTPGQIAARQAGEVAAQQIQQAGASSAGAGRGIGRLASELAASENITQGIQGLSGQIAQAESQARAQDIARAQQGLMQLIAQQEQAGLAAQQYRQNQARPGMLPVLTTAAGAGLGGYLGGPAGAQAGGQIGGAGGSMFTR